MAVALILAVAGHPVVAVAQAKSSGVMGDLVAQVGQVETKIVALAHAQLSRSPARRLRMFGLKRACCWVERSERTVPPNTYQASWCQEIDLFRPAWVIARPLN